MLIFISINIMNLSILKKIFNKEQSLKCLKYFQPNKFGKKSNRSKKITYLGNDSWNDLLSIPVDNIRDFTRDYSISEDGKYYNIHRNLDWVKNTIMKTKVLKEKSPCRPQQYSESVVKPLIRKYINEKRTEPIEDFVNREMMQSLIIHSTERINQQLKADYSEYIIMISCPNIIPTLKHSGGTDMYLLNSDNSIEELDIKTTRSIWGITEPKEAIKKLYEKQDKDRFSYNPRLYIYLSDGDMCSKDKIIEQLNCKYTIQFSYEKKDYIVNGTRLIIV